MVNFKKSTIMSSKNAPPRNQKKKKKTKYLGGIWYMHLKTENMCENTCG